VLLLAWLIVLTFRHLTLSANGFYLTSYLVLVESLTNFNEINVYLQELLLKWKRDLTRDSFLTTILARIFLPLFEIKKVGR
jgi:hypothetical protein